MNKKGQYFDSTGDPGAKFGNASPILVLGIIVFILPMIDSLIGMNLPSFVSVIGGILLAIGVVHSIMKMNK